MKKYISFFVTTLVLSLGFASCSVETDEPAGGTAVEDMCGHWVVTVDAYDSDGELLAEDPYEMGEWNTLTYNTANNDNNVMWLTDNSEFWDYTVKVSVDYNAKTFSCALSDLARGKAQALHLILSPDESAYPQNAPEERL